MRGIPIERRKQIGGTHERHTNREEETDRRNT